ncbi:MAG: helicase HerA-like domain-containing protein [Vicinamibacterales bacterium]
MVDFEKLGEFYLGREYDAAAGKATGDLVLYDSKDLVTHALIVGMTGSGKTGLGVALIEEAAIDGVPVLVVDPKGDLTNLLLSFPGLTPEDFLPWLHEDEARRAGKSLPDFAVDQAARWKKGLADWGQDGARIQKLRDSAEFTIYTPGSTAGNPVSVMRSFAKPDLDDPELLRERVQSTVSSVLALAGIDAEPVKSREHILLSTILLAAWESGESPDLATLIARVQQPPMTKVGVMDVDSFYPQKDRFEFAMAINALLASPGFSAWTQGDPLDVAAFLRTPAGKPRVSIFSIAHLDDSQRMFFVTLLLNATIGWMRTQSGTSSLRAMLYMDEIFGFFPPVANPPSKQPLLTLLKQARAAGLGVVLATQNPVDLDYKGLANIGTWCLGRLQTDRDKARVLDGLEGANTGSFDRAEIDRLLSSLASRVFLMRNVHEDGNVLFQSRWALSYLRGPLSRDEVKRLTADRKAAVSGRGAVGTAASAMAAPVPVAPGRPSPSAAMAVATATAAAASRPLLPPDVPQYFTGFVTASRPLAPAIYGAAEIRFTDAKMKVDLTRQATYLTGVSDGPVPVDWTVAEHVELAPDQLIADAPDGVTYDDVPGPAAKAKNYAAWSKQFSTWLSSNESLTLMRSPTTGEVSNPDESERDFRARLQHAGREVRDGEVERLRKKYAPKQAALAERLRRARQAVERETEQASGAKLQTAISFGATLVGALLGRKAMSAANVGRATTAARSVGRSMKESEDISRAQETVAAIEAQLAQLDDELAAETAALHATTDVVNEKLETVTLKPKRGNVTVKVVALVWQ